MSRRSSNIAKRQNAHTPRILEMKRNVQTTRFTVFPPNVRTRERQRNRYNFNIVFIVFRFQNADVMHLRIAALQFIHNWYIIEEDVFQSARKIIVRNET